jgi:hypothetical protein
MYANFYNEKLDPLQDEVLKLPDQIHTPFYLTGGTALNRCFLEHRYSAGLSGVLWIDETNKRKDFSKELKIARELLHGSDNSLYKE